MTTKTKTPVRKKTKRRVSRPAVEETVDEEVPVRASKRRPAKKAAPPKRAAKKAPAARKAAPVAKQATRPTTVRPVENPFRPGSNSHLYTEALKKGGKRSVIVRALLRKITVHPWDGSDCADPFTEVDKRLTMVVKQLEKSYGWIVERRGRGSESYVKVTPPGADAPAKATVRKAKATKKARKAA